MVGYQRNGVIRAKKRCGGRQIGLARVNITLFIGTGDIMKLTLSGIITLSAKVTDHDRWDVKSKDS